MCMIEQMVGLVAKKIAIRGLIEEYASHIIPLTPAIVRAFWRIRAELAIVT